MLVAVLAPPLPDGALGQGDRQHIAWSYSGLLAAAPIADTTAHPVAVSRYQLIGVARSRIVAESRSRIVAVPR